MKLFREPLVHFLALGGALFLLSGPLGVEDGGGRETIVVTEERIDRLREDWARAWERPPTDEELEALVRDHVREEVFYREAMALGLHRDDAVIRRRLRQKMEFLGEDLAAATDPTDEELRAFLHEHPERFRVEARLTFRHVYLDPGRRGGSARDDAAALRSRLASLGPGADPFGMGDPFPLPHEYGALRESEVERTFGPEFAAALREAATGAWTGPVESGYGLHLVQVTRRVPGRAPDLEEVRGAVQREWYAARREEANEELLRRLLEKYAVVIEGEGGGG